MAKLDYRHLSHFLTEAITDAVVATYGRRQYLNSEELVNIFKGIIIPKVIKNVAIVEEEDGKDSKDRVTPEAPGTVPFRKKEISGKSGVQRRRKN